MTASDYYNKKASRILRFQELADKNKTAGDTLHEQAHKMAEVIPFGQPILIGHHSEKSDRSYRNRIHNKFEQAFEAYDKADYYNQKATSAIDNDAISSDAPDAIELLKEKLQNLKESHEMMLHGNKIIRNKKLTDEQKISELVKIGLPEPKAKDKLSGDCMGNIGFPRYAITNSSVNIRNVEKRITELEKRKNDVTTETSIGDIDIIDSVEENRIMIIFPGVPGESIRARLKSDGFRWSPSNGAWQTYRTAKWKIQGIIKMLTVMPAYVTPVTNYQQPRDNFNLYLTGYYFNECVCEVSGQEVIDDLFYDGIHEKPATWISPEMITMQRCTV